MTRGSAESKGLNGPRSQPRKPHSNVALGGFDTVSGQGIAGWMIGSDAQLALLHAIWEMGGAILIGVAVGLPAAWLTGRLKRGEPTQVEAIAIILLLAGLSSLLGVSALLASMIAGSLVANLSHHHTRSFREIEHIEWRSVWRCWRRNGFRNSAVLFFRWWLLLPFFLS